jgi:hypothetical protein
MITLIYGTNFRQLQHTFTAVLIDEMTRSLVADGTKLLPTTRIKTTTQGFR